MNRIIYVCVILTAAMVMLSGCGSTISDHFDESEVKNKVEEVIHLTFQDDYEAILEMSDERFSTAMTVDELRSAINQVIEQAGEFSEIKNTVVGGAEEDGIDIAVAVSSVKCADATLTFTISFDSDMELCGYYIK